MIKMLITSEKMMASKRMELVANVAACDVLRTIENDLRIDSCMLYIPTGTGRCLLVFSVLGKLKKRNYIACFCY